MNFPAATKGKGKKLRGKLGRNKTREYVFRK